MIGPQWRGTAGIAINYFFVAGELLVPLLSLFLTSWRGMAGACCMCVCENGGAFVCVCMCI